MRFALIGLINLLGLATTAEAGDLRCGGSIIGSGMSQAKIVELCGEPVATASFESEVHEKAPGRHGGETIRYEAHEVLVFDVGEGSFLRSVELVDGDLRSIRELRLRGADAHAKDCGAAAKLFLGGEPSALLSYLCGEPVARQVVGSAVERVDGRRAKRKVETESWRYAVNGQELRATVRDGVIQSVQTR